MAIPLLMKDERDVPVIRPATGVTLFLVDEEGILFDERSQKLFRLNMAAACIWCHLEATCSLDDLIRSAAASLALDEQVAGKFVRSMIQLWLRCGLLDEGCRQRAGPRQIRSVRKVEMSRQISRALRHPRGVQWHHYRLLGMRFSIAYPQELRDLLAPVLSHLESEGPAPNTTRLAIAEVDGEWLILRGSKVLGACRSLQKLAPLVHGTVSSLALSQERYLLALHAGGIARDGQAMLLVGESGIGKSVLTAAMLSEGWDYLSDDMVLLEQRSLHVKAIPCSLCLKPGAWNLLAARYPHQARPQRHLRADGKTVGYLSPPVPHGGFFAPRMIRWIVFLRRLSTSPDRIAPGNKKVLARLDGLQRLIDNCCGIPSPLNHKDISRLIDWSADVHWLQLDSGDLNVTVNALREIYDGVRQQPSE
jgi:hypothetical protein